MIARGSRRVPVPSAAHKPESKIASEETIVIKHYSKHPSLLLATCVLSRGGQERLASGPKGPRSFRDRISHRQDRVCTVTVCCGKIDGKDWIKYVEELIFCHQVDAFYFNVLAQRRFTVT